MIDLNDKTIFLAGATGLVGSGILQYITDNYPKAEVRASYYRTEPFINHDRVEYVKADLRNPENCRRTAQGCDCAIMAAANTGGSYQLTSQPWQQVNDNLIMNTLMLEAFSAEKVKRVVYIGSTTLYQESDQPLKEEHLDLNLDPPRAYFGIGWVVRYIEKLCDFWHNQSDMEVVIVRAANIFGPYAKFDPRTSNFIPAIIRKAVDKTDPFEVWGSPDVTRDVIYCEDFAKAIVTVLSNDEIKFGIFNVGSGQKTTVGNVVDLALAAAGHTPKTIDYNCDKPTTIKTRTLNCSKIKRMTGWQPIYSTAEGIEKTTRWWTDNKDRWDK